MYTDFRVNPCAVLTKLGYLIDNPWSNALDRAKAAGGVLADVLMQRHLGVRPITLIGFSLGARVIFYALLELARHKAFGIVQDVILLGTTVTAPTKTWHEARSAVSGRFVNGYARNDWVLNYLFRATSGGLHTVAGLRPVEGVSGLDNVDVTDKISGHMSYRTFMPLILDQLGFPVSADFFDEPEVRATLSLPRVFPDQGSRGVSVLSQIAHDVGYHHDSRNPSFKKSALSYAKATSFLRRKAGSRGQRRHPRHLRPYHALRPRATSRPSNAGRRTNPLQPTTMTYRPG